MTQRRPSGRPQQEQAGVSVARPTGRLQLPAEPLHSLELVLETQSSPEGTAAPTFHPV